MRVPAAPAAAPEEPMRLLSGDSAVRPSPATLTHALQAADEADVARANARRQRERRRAEAASAPSSDFTVAGEVLLAPAPAGKVEPIAQIERRARKEAMESLAGLGALAEEGPAQVRSFGSSIGPSLRSKPRDGRRSGGRPVASVRPTRVAQLTCKTCGSGVIASARFCTACGAGLDVPALPVDNAGGFIALPTVGRPAPTGWRAGFFGWLLGAR